MAPRFVQDGRGVNQPILHSGKIFKEVPTVLRVGSGLPPIAGCSTRQLTAALVAG